MNEDSPEQSIVQKCKIKLTKNTKGYGWEISVVEGCKQPTMDELKEIIETTNDMMMEEYGNDD